MGEEVERSCGVTRRKRKVQRTRKVRRGDNMTAGRRATRRVEKGWEEVEET